MFPHPCGEEFERAVAAGADPAAVVPDDYVVVRGGTKPMPFLGEVFSAAVGPDLIAAACAVPYNQVRFTRAGDIRRAGGRVIWVPEFSQKRTLNLQHVNVAEAKQSSFGDMQANPVPKADRIDGNK